jgi:ATP-dependent 26S proteasome regulatory subunit
MPDDVKLIDDKTAVEKAKSILKQIATTEFRTEMSALIRSRSPLVYLVTTEERRVIEYFRYFSVVGGYRTLLWDTYNGLLQITNMQPANLMGQSYDPTVVLDHILKEAAEQNNTSGMFKGNIYLFLDFHRFLRGVNTQVTPEIERRLRTLHRMDSNTVLVMVGPDVEFTPALEKCVNIVDFPYPNREEIKIALNSVIDPVIPQCPMIKQEVEKSEEEIINAVSGLSLPEAESAFAKSVVTLQRIDIPTLLKEKRQIIRKTGLLEFFQTDIGLEDVGGLGNLTTWLKRRRSAFDKEAGEYGVQTPKGILLVGVPGAGKSLAAKACAKYYNMPLLRLDFGSLFGSLVGESENRARRAIKVAEAIAPCVLWADEIEKGLAGWRSSGTTDSGVTSRVISTFLTWMQEKTSQVFIICTANNHDVLPTEFMRAGRFDEIFFVDLPTVFERREIAEVLLRRKKRNAGDFDLGQIAGSSDGYTGAEIEKAIDGALIEGFNDGKRSITTQDIVTALGKFHPLSKIRPEDIEAMQIWAEERCLRANTPDPVAGDTTSRKVVNLDKDLSFLD